MKKISISLAVCALFLIGFAKTTQAVIVGGGAGGGGGSIGPVSGFTQSINLQPGWNLVSTPRVIASHAFSSTSTDYQIYVLNPANLSGWSTMADFGQTEFTPLYGYFVKNTTNANQTLTFNYAQDLADKPSQRLFSRSFPTVGWYSLGFANPSYLTAKCFPNSSVNNNSLVLQSLIANPTNQFDFLVDLSPQSLSALDSLGTSGNWITKAPQDIGLLNNFSELKGYAIYINKANTTISGTQNIDPVTDCVPIPVPPVSNLHAVGTNVSDASGAIFMITPDATRRAYTATSTFLSYGFNSLSLVVPASSEDLALPVGPAIPPRDGSIVCPSVAADDGTCFLITGGQTAAFSPSLIGELGFNLNNAITADVSGLSTTTPISDAISVHRPGVLINNNGTVQLVGANGLLGISDSNSFNSWGFNFADVVPANAADKTMLQASSLASRNPGELNPAALSGSLQITPKALPSATIGQPYSTQIEVSGGTAPYTWTTLSTTYPSGCCVLGLNGNSPSSLSPFITFNTQSSAVVIDTNLAGTYFWTIQVTDATGNTATQTLALTINAAIVTPGVVTVSLATDNPTAGTLVSTPFFTSPGQTSADIAHLKFTGSGTVNQIVLNRIGVSADTSINNIYLYIGNNRITDASSFSQSKVTFTNSVGLFTVNGSTTVSVRVDVAGGSAGQTVGAQLVSYTVGSDAPIISSISGNLFTIIQVNNFATVTVPLATSITSSGANNGNAGSINVPNSNAILWSAPVTVSQRNVLFKYITFKQIGSIPAGAILNYKLFVDGTQVSSTPSLSTTSNNIFAVTFDMTAAPASLPSGTHTVELRGDIVSGASFSYNFSLPIAGDAVFTDSQYLANVPFTLANGSPVFFLSPGTTTINSGTVTVLLDPLFTANQFIANQTQAVLGQWTFRANGEGIKVQNLQISLNYVGTPAANEGFNNLSLYVNGSAVGPLVSALGAGNTYVFGSSNNLFTIPAGTTVTLMVKGDSVLNTPTLVTAVRADLITPINSLQGVSSLTLSPSGGPVIYTGRPLTVGSSNAVTATNNAFSNTTLTANTLNQKIGSFVIQAGTFDGVKVTSLTVGLTGILPLTSLNNLYIVTPAGNAIPISSPGSSNNFSINFTVAANQTVIVDVFADVGSGAGTVITNLNGVASGVASNQTVFLNSNGLPFGTAIVGQTLTVGTGTLSSVALTGSSPTSSFVLGGSINQPAATYTFHVSVQGGVSLTELGFNIVGGVTPNTISLVTVGGSSGQVVNGKALVTGLNIAVPVGSAGLDVPITVTYTNVGSPSTVIDQTSLLSLNHVKYLAGNNTVVNGTAGFGDATTGVIGTNGIKANTMFLSGTIPAVVLQSSPNTLVAGSDIIGSITISSTGGRLDMVSLPIVVSTAGGATASSGIISLFDHNTGQSVGTTSGNTISLATNASAANTFVFSNTDGLNQIAGGSNKTYDVQVSGVDCSGISCSLVLQLGSSALFTFNDINGGVVNIPASVGATNYIVNYPNNSVSIRN